MGNITIYTDGAAGGNPGPGGYGVLMYSGNHVKEMSDGYRLTTNNRMELLSVIVALESIKTPGSNVDVYSDSRYVVDSINNGWIHNWKNQFSKQRKNMDLWLRLLKVLPRHKVKFHWVKGHADTPQNVICDKLAVKASRGKDLKVDYGYEGQSNDLFA